MTRDPRDWDPNTQPRTARDFEAMLRHVLRLRLPTWPAPLVASAADAVRIGMERYGLRLRRDRAWRLPKDARLDCRTLADAPDLLAFACLRCPRHEQHRRHVLIERFGSFVPLANIPYALSSECEKRNGRYDKDRCGFDFEAALSPMAERDEKRARGRR